MKVFYSVLLSLITLTGFAQTSYYVSIAGNDSNDGSLASPWLSIQYGCDQLNPGDTLNIRGGTYNEKIDIDVSGNTSSYITIQNYQTENVVIDAISFSDDNPIIWTDNSYLRIKGLHLTSNIHNYSTGLMLQGAAHHIEILNNKISNIRFSSDPNAPVTPNTNAVPLDIWADLPQDSIHTITIKGNEIFNNQTGYSENIAAGGNFSGFLIEDNIVHDNTNIGIDISGNYQTSPNQQLDQGRNGIIRRNVVYNCNSLYSAAAGIYIDGGKDIIVENNICHHNGYGGEIGCEENGYTSGVTFRNNVFYKNEDAGMHIGGYDVNTTGVVLNSNIYNNTFYQNDLNENYNGELILTKSENCNIENNIFYLSQQNVYMYAYRTQTNLSLDYNLVYTNSGSSSVEVSGNYNTTGLQNFYIASGYGAHSSFGDPLFFDSAISDFHIQINSPAIDMGNPSYTASDGEVDMDGQIRIYNGIIDCGADEYNSVFGINSIPQNTVRFFPNPTTGIVFMWPELVNFKYEVFSQNGKLIKVNNATTNIVNITELDEGFYFIKITDNVKDKEYHIKVIKKM